MITTQQQVPGVSNVDAPAATTVVLDNGGNYVLAWMTGDGGIAWMNFPATNELNTTYAFGPQQQVAGAGTSGGPALATLNAPDYSIVYMAWKGEGTDPRIFLSQLEGSNWAPGTQVPAVGTQSSPALTATGSELFLAFMGEHDQGIWWALSGDGITWTENQRVPGAVSTDTPALAAFGDTVYMVWKGANDNSIWLTKYTAASGWDKTATALPSNFATSKGPALGVGSTGNLHLVWKGASDNNMWESFLGSNSTTWSPPAKISTVATNARPALATQTPASDADQVLLAWKGASDNTLWIGPLDDLQTVIPGLKLPPGAMPLPESLGWSWPVTGFGSGPNNANCSYTLTLTNDGTATFSGQYTDSGNVLLFPSPAQNYNAVIAVVGTNKVAYTFSNSGQVATGGKQAVWNITQTSTAIQQNWGALYPSALAYATCSNTSDLGSVIDGIIHDIGEVLGWFVTAYEIITGSSSSSSSSPTK